MKIRVLYFSLLRQATGCNEEFVDVREGSSLKALVELLAERHPTLRPHLPALMLTRNQEWAGRGEELAEGDEVGLMPPVSGG